MNQGRNRSHLSDCQAMAYMHQIHLNVKKKTQHFVPFMNLQVGVHHAEIFSIK
jgi:hypothetical protein